MKKPKKLWKMILPFIGAMMVMLAGCAEDPVVTDIEGNQYQTVTIGEQEWMAENLRTTRYRDGSEIPGGLSRRDWQMTTEGAFAVYPYEGVDMIAAYGKLYNWYAVADPRGLCPEGWRVPSDEDWTQLVNYLMEEHDLHNDGWLEDVRGVGNALKASRQEGHPLGGRRDTQEHPRWNAGTPHYGTNDVGFAALPGGTRRHDDVYSDFGNLGGGAYWWSSSELDAANAWYRRITRGGGSVSRLDDNKANGFSIRCIKEK